MTSQTGSSNSESYVVSVTAYTLACFTGYSRISANRHHYRDVIAGATLGMLTSYYLYRRQNDEGSYNQHKKEMERKKKFCVKR